VKDIPISDRPLVAKLSRPSQFRPGGCRVLEEYFCSVIRGDDDGETAIG